MAPDYTVIQAVQRRVRHLAFDRRDERKEGALMTKKTVLAAAATTASIVLLLSSALAATAVGATAPPASTCAECCQDETLCEALVGLAGLHAAVDELVPEAGLAISLDAKVDAATTAVLADRPTTALNLLDAFGNELTAADQAGKVSETTTNLLKARTDATKQAVNKMRA